MGRKSQSSTSGVQCPGSIESTGHLTSSSPSISATRQTACELLSISGLLAKPLFLRPQFRREFLSVAFGLEDRTQLNRSFLEGGTPDPLDGII